MRYVTPNLYFCILWDLGVTYYILEHLWRERTCTILHAQVGPVQIHQKVCQKTLRRNGIFAFGGICGSRSAFR
jgi:hypothetical protein